MALLFALVMATYRCLNIDYRTALWYDIHNTVIQNITPLNDVHIFCQGLQLRILVNFCHSDYIFY